MNKLVIYGAGETAEIAYEYFTHDSDYEVVAFCVDDQYKKSDSLLNTKLISLRDLKVNYPPAKFKIFVAASFDKLNRNRELMFSKIKSMGYACANYISSKAFVWHNAQIGENVMIFENNVIQYSCKIGNNVILWSGNHIGHQSVIKDNVFVSSHCVISGYCVIGENSFLGVNSTFNNNIEISKDTFVSSGSLIVKNINEPGGLYIGSPARRAPKSSWQVFNISKR